MPLHLAALTAPSYPNQMVHMSRHVLTLAEQGDASAQYNLGVTYRTGEGVPQDSAEAVRWYRLAAEQGYA